MFFDKFQSKFFGNTTKSKNPMNDSYYYDSNGCIKSFEQIISIEKDKLKILNQYKSKMEKEREKGHWSFEFKLLSEQMEQLQIDSQQKHIEIQEDLVYMMKNTVALEKEVYSMVNELRNHPKLKQDNQIWNEIVENHLPRFRTFGKLMDEYADKLQKRMEKER